MCASTITMCFTSQVGTRRYVHKTLLHLLLTENVSEKPLHMGCSTDQIEVSFPDHNLGWKCEQPIRGVVLADRCT